MCPATKEQVIDAVTYVLALLEPGAPKERIRILVRVIAERQYGAAELAYAAQELPFDEEIGDKIRFNRPLLPADFERLVKKRRRVRLDLSRAVPLDRAAELAQMFPGEVEMEHFHLAGYSPYNDPRYFYCPHPRPIVNNTHPGNQIEGS